MAMLECDKVEKDEQFPTHILADGWIELEFRQSRGNKAIYVDAYREKVAVYDNGGTLVADMRED